MPDRCSGLWAQEGCGHEASDAFNTRFSHFMTESPTGQLSLRRKLHGSRFAPECWYPPDIMPAERRHFRGNLAVDLAQAKKGLRLCSPSFSLRNLASAVGSASNEGVLHAVVGHCSYMSVAGLPCIARHYVAGRPCQPPVARQGNKAQKNFLPVVLARVLIPFVRDACFG